MNKNNSPSEIDEMNIDIHCHPSMKPFGLAYPGNVNQPDPSLPNSIWHDDPPTPRDKRANMRLGATRFSQSNFTELHKGKFKVVIAALYPIEKGFFTSHLLRTGIIADYVYNNIAEIGRRKIDFIQKNNDVFNELLCEYDFFRQLHDKELMTYGRKVRYRLTKHYNDIKANLNSQDEILSVVLSIEGASSFNNNIDPDATLDILSILNNINIVKKWEYPPLFVTFSHHFNSKMGGHARSLPPLVGRLLDQTEGMDSDLTPEGKKVIDLLLSKTNGSRIYIDVKHMSRKVRKAYYNILAEEYNNSVPIIVSHGAANNYPVMDPDLPSPEEINEEFNGRDINFYDDEFVRIEKSDGIFGLQIDERQITNKHQRRKIKRTRGDQKEKLERWTKQIWKQVSHIAEVLDKATCPAWDVVSLGTDFDGMVNPIDGYWTSADIPNLRDNLLKPAAEYMSARKGLWSLQSNDIPPELVIEKMFSKNALEFLEKYYR